MKNHKSKKELESSGDKLIEELKTSMVELNNMQLTQLNILKNEVDCIIKMLLGTKRGLKKILICY